jgi:hypothetical protein
MQNLGAITPIQRQQRPFHLCNIHRHDLSVRRNPDT